MTANKKHAGTVALIFCGGKGVRMQPITFLMRKEMLPIGPRREPMLDHIVDHLKSHGIRNIVFVGSDKRGGDVANYFGDGRRFGVKATHHPDPPGCGGTGHALLWAIKRLGLKGRDLLVYYGDMFNDIDLRELLETHREKGATATIVVSEEYVIPKGLADVASNGVVRAFQEKPKWHGPEKIAVGVLCINSDRLVKELGGLPSSASQLKFRHKDLMGGIVKDLVTKHEVSAYTTNAHWRDIGSFQDYQEVQQEYSVDKRRHTKESPTEPGLSVFLSYHMSAENKKLIDTLLCPCLSFAGYRVVCGGKLDVLPIRGNAAKRAHQMIDSCDIVVAIATPVGKDNLPSTGRA